MGGGEGPNDWNGAYDSEYHTVFQLVIGNCSIIALLNATMFKLCPNQSICSIYILQHILGNSPYISTTWGIEAGAVHQFHENLV